MGHGSPPGGEVGVGVGGAAFAGVPDDPVLGAGEVLAGEAMEGVLEGVGLHGRDVLAAQPLDAKVDGARVAAQNGVHNPAPDAVAGYGGHGDPLPTGPEVGVVEGHEFGAAK